MVSILGGSLVLSVLHALIPNHWLPILSIARQNNWSLKRTSLVTLIAGGAHALSTVMLGVFIGIVGLGLAKDAERYTHVVAPVILIVLGIFYIYRHHRHKHFHLHPEQNLMGSGRIITGLAIAMFFSPCFEIEAYFLLAGTHGWSQVVALAFLYVFVTVSGMVIWVRFAYKGVTRINWHGLEHNAGIITGSTLIITGIISFFFH